MPAGLPRSLSGIAVTVLAALPVLAAPASESSAAAPRNLGAIAFQKRATTAQAPQLTDFRLARRSGADHTRINVSWRAVDNTLRQGLPNLRAKTDRRSCTTPWHDWCNLDRMLRRYRSIGLRVNPVLIGTPEWASPLECKAQRNARACRPMLHAMEDWRRFVVSAVRRYGPNGSFWNKLGAPGRFDMQVWEVWNEPDLATFWDANRSDAPSGDAKEYGRLVRATAGAVDTAALSRGRRARIAGPSVSSFRRATTRAWLATLGEGPARLHLDVASGHLYGRTAEAVIAQVERLRELLPARPMWITENGFGAGSGCSPCVGSATAQRREFKRLMGRLGRRPYVTSFTWFMGARHPAFGGTHGLYRDNGRPRPVARAFRALAAR